ncbi:MAG TPA: xanthine dehydrogenase family protein molybdopterin-binding subunit [Acidobacteriaceae bacterium]|jgi:xanthine dehydrogenase YagR molybdenum-binding subunit|nr:xanthine dehydrogenase family protein molybdopterin-binding subunit [Acidobacteriaceae bacterium]
MSTSVIGAPIQRIDGSLKVTGAAKYAVDNPFDNVAFGVPVASTVGNARIVNIDTSIAQRMPGVLTIIHHGNTDQLFRPAGQLEQSSRAGEVRPPFEDDKVYYYGQYVALVIANTFEQAQDAASKVKVEYETHPNVVEIADAPPPQGPPRIHYARGKADDAFDSAAVKIDQTYILPVETHNPMEMHGTIAKWEGDKVILYESSQGVVNHQHVLSEMLGIPVDQVQVLSPFIGSGFGGKLFPWPHSLLAAMAARRVNRPVKVVVPRALMFTTVGHRPLTQQRMRIGATQQGKLVSVQHDVLQPTSMVDTYVEQCTGVTTMLYSCENLTANQTLIPMNIGTPTPMRGPGIVPGLYPLESAMDELAIRLNMDPLELRLKNYAEQDESFAPNRPFSSKHLRECYQIGAEKFTWSKRTPQVGSMKQGDEILGWGMATATWHAGRGSATVRVRLHADGTARATCATQDIGTGTYTVFAQVVSEKTGIPIEKIEVVLGDSSLPDGPTSGGSTVTATVLPAVTAATNGAIDRVIAAAQTMPSSPFKRASAGGEPPRLVMTAGRIHAADQPPESGIPFQEVLAHHRLAALEAESRTAPDPATSHQFSAHSFGAQFVEVAWDPGIARLRVNRALTVIDAGRIINHRTGRNQILGAVVMGIGMAMFEETIYDPRNAKPLNNNFADYIVSTNADIPQLDCIFVEYPDLHLNEYGARGIGEIGLAGVASAVTMAVYHATGVRVRKLPVRIEDLLAGDRRMTA